MSQTITDETVICAIWSVIVRMRQRGEHETMDCLLNEEKLLHLSLLVSSRKEVAWPFSVGEELVRFVQKINKLVMEHFKAEGGEGDLRLFAKAVDILMHPLVVQSLERHQLGRLKVLTFNNLACLYKQKGKFMLALKAVTFALTIEEHMAKNNRSEEKYDIVPTYLNKAAIYSDMRKHDKAIEQITKAKKCIDVIEKELQEQLCSATDSGLKVRLEEKKHYGLYMKMLLHYNMGVEKEHLKLLQSAVEYYREGRGLAIAINNTFMVSKFDAILNNIL